MTHSHKRQEWWKEGAISLATGTLYGVSNTLTGHPLDTVKCKMQAQSGYMADRGMVATMKHILRDEGLRGFYRGVIPPVWGSMVYRSAQFATFESVYTKLDHVGCKHEIPLTGGIQTNTCIAAFIGGSARAVLESPIEYAKVRRQTGQTWEMRGVYNGFSLQWARTCPMMTIYFLNIDSLRRHTDLFKTQWGQFLASGGSAAFGFTCVWPLETLKNQVQANTKIEGIANPTLRQRVQSLGGFFGLYRGITPGLMSIFARNGVAMVVMQAAQKKLVDMGLRD
eukprot:TRINITY_DN6835_c1_g1_i1.p1 TRINITY_DN6835_c1_g1~~TRINITY_DN6835_c1_g1_i1.p1  ORF type:complete len:281 (+),score=101.86 TRINITY_DN6835_c1_g1_i1:274-1116(+)